MEAPTRPSTTGKAEMAHTTEELLLAAAVRERVGAMRIALGKDMNDEEYAAFMKQPVAPLIKEVLIELNQIADVIKRTQSEG